MEKVELLAPAGSLEKLKVAIIFGADAVYIGGEEFSLRAGAQNFNKEEMLKGIEFAHMHHKKVYLTANIIPHVYDIDNIKKYFSEVKDIDFDGIIVSDPGIIELVKKYLPKLDIHLSTQANNTNNLSADFWHKNGIKRIVLARELSLEEIRTIKEKSNQNLEFEVFVHGAMCISYSGRCLLSNYMTNRDSNQGNCSHPCRWKYYLVEEKRPNEYIPVEENSRGTFIYNSKDLCMIEHINEIVESGVKSLKIEGRIKSSFYVATVVKAYREAIDNYYNSIKNYQFDNKLLNEIKKVSHRNFTTGFYLNKPTGNDQVYTTSSYIREYDFIGVVLDYNKSNQIAKVEQRNRFFKDDVLEVVNPKGNYFTQKIYSMKDEEGQEIETAPHPKMIVYLRIEKEVFEYTFLRKQKSEQLGDIKKNKY
ncbi:MAG: U32 family peptidase [Clostridiales bacterium]